MKSVLQKISILALFCFFALSCKEEPNASQKSVASDQEMKETIKVNPAHGLPGHVCSLPVGAPLDGSPTPVQPQQVSTSISPVRVDQTPEINPPHGQPGHDCSVPVGAKFEQ